MESVYRVRDVPLQLFKIMKWVKYITDMMSWLHRASRPSDARYRIVNIWLIWSEGGCWSITERKWTISAVDCALRPDSVLGVTSVEQFVNCAFGSYFSVHRVGFLFN